MISHLTRPEKANNSPTLKENPRSRQINKKKDMAACIDSEYVAEKKMLAGLMQKTSADL